MTGADDGDSVLRALAVGARGYLRKDSITDELLISAIFTVASGGIFLDAKTFSLLRASLPPSQPALIDERQRLAHLSPDDVALLRLVALGFDNDQIGLQLPSRSRPRPFPTASAISTCAWRSPTGCGRPTSPCATAWWRCGRQGDKVIQALLHPLTPSSLHLSILLPFSPLPAGNSSRELSPFS